MVVKAFFTPLFERTLRKIKDFETKRRIKKKVEEILENPNIGKPLRFQRKGERSVRIPPFRLIYTWEKDVVCFLNLGKRDKVYREH